VVSPEYSEGPKLLLEPDAHPAAKPFTSVLVADGIPYTSFAVADVTRSTPGCKDSGCDSARNRPRWDR
jgi:hypothetical protein